jgi:hypothetical protein
MSIRVPDGRGGFREVKGGAGKPAAPPKDAGGVWSIQQAEHHAVAGTRQFLPLVVTHRGARVPARDLQVALVPRSATAEVWQQAAEDNGLPGVVLDSPAPGVYAIRVRTVTGALLDGGRVRVA